MEYRTNYQISTGHFFAASNNVVFVGRAKIAANMKNVDDEKDRFVVTAPLYVNAWAYSRLNKRFNVAHHLFNAFLGEAERRRKAMMASDIYLEAIKLYKVDNKDAKKKFEEARKKFGYYIMSSAKNDKTDGMEVYAARITKGTWLAEHVDAITRNKLATRAFRASERSIYGKKTKKKNGQYSKPKVKFKRFGKDHVYSVEGGSSKSPLRMVLKDDFLGVIWGDIKLPFTNTDDIKLQPIIDKSVVVKYSRIKRKLVEKTWQFFAQLVCVGRPALKQKHKLQTGIVGCDLGPSSVAYVSDHHVSLSPLCGDLKLTNAYKWLEKEKAKLQRKIDRQRRDANPENYNENGTPKKGRHRWKKSKRQSEVEVRLRDTERRIAEHRKMLHAKMANEMRSQGNILNIDKDSYKGWQKGRYGKSIGRNAPGLFVATAENVFNRSGGTVNKVNTFISRSSQTCPCCGDVEKKELKDRIFKCEKCGYEMQRDIVSAIINKSVDVASNTPNIDESKKFIMEQRHLLQEGVGRVIQSAREGHHLPSTFGSLSELERISCELAMNSKNDGLTS